MLGSAPLLVIGHAFTVVVIELVWKLEGGIQKHWLLWQALPSLFFFTLFSPPPPLFAPATLAILFNAVVCFDFVLFSPSLARSRERNYFAKPWNFFSFPKINFIKSRKISTRQGFKKNKPFVRVTPAQTQPNLR